MMGDPLLSLVERTLQSSLSLQLLNSCSVDSDSSGKSPTPMTVVNTTDGSPVAHLINIPTELENENLLDLDSRSSPKAKFGVVTLNGCVSIYDTMFRRILWKRETNLERVSWAALSLTQRQPSSLLVYSRQSGLHNLKVATKEEESLSKPEEPMLILSKTHVGFCKPYQSQGQGQNQQCVIIPIGTEKIGFYQQGQTFIPPSFEFSWTIMALKKIVNESSSSNSKYVLVTTEDGYVNVVKYENPGENDNGEVELKVILVSKLLLPNQSQGVCIEGDDDESIFVIGTNLKAIYLLKWTQEKSKLHPVGKKILPDEGVSCLALQNKGKDEGRLLAAGCFDGTIRLFDFPNMTQISTIQYHRSQINSLLFINEQKDDEDQDAKFEKRKMYLLCGASDSNSLSVWRTPIS